MMKKFIFVLLFAPSFALAGFSNGTVATGIIGTVPIVNGGTNQTTFTTPASGVNAISYFDGTRIVTDAVPGNLGYNSITKVLAVSGVAATGQVLSNSKNVLSVSDVQAGQVPVAITVGASPFAYTATFGGMVSVVGGTVSAVTLTRSGIVVWSSAVSNDIIPVRAGDITTVTYTVAPTMYQITN